MAKAVEKAIEVKNLQKHFKDVRAVDGISFDVKRGEVFGFLGPNGAGKTTTIRCMMDFISPTGGSVSILGKDAHKDSVFLKSKIGYLSGNVRLYGNWTGHDHIKFVESIRGESRTKGELIEKLNYDPGKRFKNLSSGNQQKLGLILALMNDPEILIMDEPTVGLDPLLQNRIYEFIDELKAKGTTIFVSSHNLPEVERICDRVGIIKEGELVELGGIGELSGKRLHYIRLKFKDKYTKKEFDFNGVESIREIHEGLELTVGGDIESVLAKISKHKLKDIEITKASLEEIFLKFYDKDGK